MDLQFTAKLNDLVSGKLSGIQKSVGNLESTFSNIGGKIAGVFAVSKIVDFGKSALETLKNYEYFSASLKTLMNGDIQGAKALQTELVQLAKTTPFSLQDVQTGTKNLMAYGFQANQIIGNLKMLGDVSAGVSAPLTDIVYLYGTLKASGRVTQMDINQFAGRGIPIYKGLADAMHKTTGEIKDLVSGGKVGFSDIENAFKGMTKEGGQFFGMMENQSKTVGGQISNLMDSWDQLQLHLAQSKTGVISIVVNKANDFISWLDKGQQQNNFYDDNQQKLSEAYKYSSFWKSGEAVDKRYYVEENENKKMFNDESMASSYADLKGKDYFSLTSSEVSKEFSKQVYGILQNSGTGAAGALNQYKLLSGLQSELKEQSKKGEISTKLFINEQNTLNQALGQVTAALKSSNATSKTELNKKKSSNDELGTGVSVTGNRPQNLYINITKLVEQLTIQTQTLTEAGPKVKALISQYLLEAVNDVNNIQR